MLPTASVFLLATAALGDERATATVTPAELAVPDPWRAPAAPALAEDAREACASGLPAGLSSAVIEVRTDGIHYAGRSVVPIAEGAIPSDQLDGTRIRALHDALLRSWTDLSILRGWGCTGPSIDTPRVLVAADGSLPYGLVRSVLATVGGAGFAHVDLRVADGSAKAAPDARVLDDGPPAAIRLDPAGSTVYGFGDPIVLKGHDPKMLRTVIGRLAPNAAGQNELVLQPADSLPWSMVLDSLGTVAWDDRDKPLLPATVLGQNPDAPAEDAPAPPAGRAGIPEALPASGAPVFRTRLPIRGRADDAPAASGAIPGPPDNKAIDKVIRKDLHEIKWCFDKAAQSKPKLEGTVVVGFTIAADGKPTEVAVHPDGTLAEKAVTDCVVGRIQGLTFSISEGPWLVRRAWTFPMEL